MRIPGLLATGVTVFLLAAGPGLAYTVPQSVVANGGGLAANAGTAVTSTAGQAAIGPIASPAYQSGAGFWYQSVAASAGIPLAPGEMPSRFWLAPNYPNPFGETTSISFAVPKPCHVTVVLYDVRGREVLTLADDDMAPGYQTRLLRGEALSRGIYFCHMRAGSFVMTRKVVCLE